ncbi:MAG: ABC transporter permease [Pseudomonadota bacterium]
MMGEKVTVYSAKWDPHISTFATVRALFKEIRDHRWHIAQLFRRDFFANSRLTRFGSVWNYILPLVPLTVWVLLNALRLFPGFNGVSSVVYVTLGITFWFLFAGFVSVPIGTIESRIKEVARSQMPLVGMIIAGFATLSFDTLVRIVGTAIVFAIFHGLPDWKIILVPIVVFFGTLFFSGLGLTLGVFNLAYRDIGKLVTIALQYGILLSSIIFPLDQIEFLGKISLFNPFYVFIDAIRTLTVFGEIRHPVPLAVFSGLGVLIFLFSCRLLYISQSRLKGFAQ